VGQSPKLAMFPVFYFLADETVCTVLFSYNSNKPLQNSFPELTE